MSNRQQRRANERSLASLKKRKPKNVKIEGRKVITSVTRGDKTVDFIADLSGFNFAVSFGNILGIMSEKYLDKLYADITKEYDNEVQAQIMVMSELSKRITHALNDCFGNGVVEELLGNQGARPDDLFKLIKDDLKFVFEYANLDYASEFEAYSVNSIDDKDGDA